jgi:hypothetical protein
MGQAAKRIQAYQTLQAEQQVQALRQLSQALITTFDISDLMNVLAEGLPRLGIPSCYTKHGHKLSFCFEQKATIMGILTSIPMSSSLGLRRIPHDPDRVY